MQTARGLSRCVACQTARRSQRLTNFLKSNLLLHGHGFRDLPNGQEQGEAERLGVHVALLALEDVVALIVTVAAAEW